jgi:hypothetical protein
LISDRALIHGDLTGHFRTGGLSNYGIQGIVRDGCSEQAEQVGNQSVEFDPEVAGSSRD